MAEEQNEEKKITDEQYITEWRSMLKIFKDLIKGDPKPESIMDELLELKEEASNTFMLTPAQKRGITERVDNYINGSYGRGLAKTAH